MSVKSVVIVSGPDGREFGFETMNGRPANIAGMIDAVKLPGERPYGFDAGTFAARLVFEALGISWRAKLLTAREFNSDVGQDFTYLVAVELNRFGQPYLNVMVYQGARGELPAFCGATGGLRVWAA